MKANYLALLNLDVCLWTHVTFAFLILKVWKLENRRVVDYNLTLTRPMPWFEFIHQNCPFSICVTYVPLILVLHHWLWKETGEKQVPCVYCEHIWMWNTGRTGCWVAGDSPVPSCSLMFWGLGSCFYDSNFLSSQLRLFLLTLGPQVTLEGGKKRAVVLL